MRGLSCNNNDQCNDAIIHGVLGVRLRTPPRAASRGRCPIGAQTQHHQFEKQQTRNELNASRTGFCGATYIGVDIKRKKRRRAETKNGLAPTARINVNMAKLTQAWREPGGREKGAAAQKVGLERAGARVARCDNEATTCAVSNDAGGRTWPLARRVALGPKRMVCGPRPGMYGAGPWPGQRGTQKRQAPTGPTAHERRDRRGSYLRLRRLLARSQLGL